MKSKSKREFKTILEREDRPTQMLCKSREAESTIKKKRKTELTISLKESIMKT